MSDDLREYLDAVYGAGAGFAHIAVGTGHHVADGKFTHRSWTETEFRWPEEADGLAREIGREAVAGGDVYVCPYLMTGHKRGRGQSSARPLVHADVDGDISLDKVQALGGFAVGSGTAEHAHVYVPLTESVSLDHHRALCEGLRAYLGGDDKIADNDLLRPPGTWNHKPVAFGTGQAAPVSWLLRPSAAARTPQQLAEALGVVLPVNGSQTAVSGLQVAAPVDLTRLPTRVRDALAEVTGNRSDDTMRVVFACQDTGLTLAKTRAVVNSRADLRERLAERHDDDVRECWLKVTDTRAADRAIAEWMEEIERAEAARLSQAGTTTHVATGNEFAGVLDTLRAAALDTAGLDTIPDPDPLITGLLYSNTTAWTIGKAGDGKSFVTLDQAGCIGTGTPWQDHGIAQGNVLYVVAEGAAGIRKRVRAWEKSYGRSMTGVTFLPVAVQAGKPTDWQSLIAFARELGAVLVILDTQARVTVGMEENSAKDMGVFIDKLERLRIATKACVLVVHHKGRLGDHLRGSSAMDGAGDAVLEVVKDGDLITVKNPKQKHIEPHEDIVLRLSPIGDSVVLVLTDDKTGRDRSAAAVFAGKWWDLFGDDPVSVTKAVDAELASKATFYRHVAVLLKSGAVVKKTAGERTSYRLIKKPECE